VVDAEIRGGGGGIERVGAAKGVRTIRKQQEDRRRSLAFRSFRGRLRTSGGRSDIGHGFECRIEREDESIAHRRATA